MCIIIYKNKISFFILYENRLCTPLNVANAFAKAMRGEPASIAMAKATKPLSKLCLPRFVELNPVQDLFRGIQIKYVGAMFYFYISYAIIRIIFYTIGYTLLKANLCEQISFPFGFIRFVKSMKGFFVNSSAFP